MKTSVIATIAFVGLSISASAHAQGMKIARSEVPQAVLSQFKSAYPTARIYRTNKEIKAGTTYYEIESREGNLHRDLLYAADGSVWEIEEIIRASQLPPGVKHAIQSKYPKAKIKTVEENTQPIPGSTNSGTLDSRDAVVHYEVLLRQKDKNFELIFNPDGSLAQP